MEMLKTVKSPNFSAPAAGKKSALCREIREIKRADSRNQTSSGNPGDHKRRSCGATRRHRGGVLLPKGQKADATKGAGDVAAPKKLKLSGDAQGAPAKAASKLSASALKKLKLAEEKKRQKALEEEQAEVDAAEAAMAHVTEPESSDEEVDGRQEKGSLVVGAVVRIGEGKKKVEGVIRPVEADSEGRAHVPAAVRPTRRKGQRSPSPTTTTA